MALNRKDSLSQLSAGWLRGRYFLRDLFGQTLILFAVIASTVGYATYQWYQIIPADDFSYLMLYFKGFFWAEVIQLQDHTVVFKHTEGIVKIEAGKILANSDLVNFKDQYFQKLVDQVKSTLPWGAGSWVLMAIVIFWSGKIQKDNEFLEGVRQVPLSVYHRFLKSNRIKSQIKLGNAHWVKAAEVQHLLVVGDTGTGKSQLLNQLLSTIRAMGDLAIVYDPKGDMVRDFYQEGHDVLYSPFDNRSPRWDLWQDLTTDQDLETFAEAVIKEHSQDSFWSKSARMVLIAGLKQAKKQYMSFSQAMNMIMTRNLDEVSEWLDRTEVASDFSNPKTAGTIMTELKTQARALRYLPEVDHSSQSFSIKSWMNTRFAQMKLEECGPQPWLFLPIQKQFRASSKTIMAAQVEMISNFILSKRTDRNRRIWFIIDELPSLGKLAALPGLLAEGRGYGVASVLAIQNFSQLLEAYKKDGAHNIAGLCSSLVAMRSSDTQTMEYLSKRFGKQIRKEMQTNQSLSKGKAGSFSEGHSEHIAERAAVSETDINTLPDLKAFFKAKGVPNPVKIDIAIAEIPAMNPSHCPIKEQTIDVEEAEQSEVGASETQGECSSHPKITPPLQVWDV